MTRHLLALHWKAVRWGLLPLVIAAFGLPFFIAGRLDPNAGSARFWEQMAVVSPVFPMLAMAVGVTLALTAWSWDHRQGHVYALSLPVARWQYASTKFMAGAALAAIPALTLALGGALATALVDLPPALQAYPGMLALRFFLATLTAYALMFALASGTIRTATVVISLVVGALVLGDTVIGFASAFVPALQNLSLSDIVVSVALEPHSPLRVFTGNWMLFDV